MTVAMEKNWKKFLRNNPEIPSETFLRKGSPSVRAYPWVHPKTAPSLPLRKLSNSQIYGGWENSHNVRILRDLIAVNPLATFRELAIEMLDQTCDEKTPFPYTWWIWDGPTKERTVYEDAAGVTFVKLDGKWQLVYSSHALGLLTGAQGTGYENVPRNSYFVVWENEEVARAHSG